MNSENRNPKGGGIAANREEQIQAMLDGELDEASARALKDAAGHDRDLARAIVDAYRLQTELERLGAERAPSSLRRRLRRIPREQRRLQRSGLNRSVRWTPPVALATLALAILAVALLRTPVPERADVERARRDVAVAFQYVDRFVGRTGDEIHEALGGELEDGIKEVLAEQMPYTEQSLKEETT